MHMQCKTMRFGNCFCVVLLVLLGCSDYTNARSPGTCRVGELRCQNGDLCVPKEQVCDGKRECDDGLDEYVCKFRHGLYSTLHNYFSTYRRSTAAAIYKSNGGPIPSSRLIRQIVRNAPKKGAVFQCQFGGVIPLNRLCDSNVNCLDGSDESEICENNSCLPGQFRCAYGACIPDWQMCNGRVNCPDGSDETADVCENIECKPTEFRCRYGGCIRKTQICDVKKHCADGSDESEFLCLITRAKMLSEWEKEEEEENKKAQKNFERKLESDTKSPNSVLPSSSFTRLSPINIPVLSSGGGGRFPPTKTAANIHHTTATTIISTPTSTTPKTITSSSHLSSSTSEKPGPARGETEHVAPSTKPVSGSDKKDNRTKNMDDDSNSGTTSKKSSIIGEKDEVGNNTAIVPDVPKECTGGGDTCNTSNSRPTTPSSLSTAGGDQEDSKSSTEQPTVATCVLPEIPENADAVVSHCMFSGKPCDQKTRVVSVGTQIQYECDAGYSLYGPSVITCQEGGKWSLTPPFCEIMLDVRFGLGSVIPKDFRPRCPSLTSPKGTLVECIDPTNLAVKSCSELQKPGVEARFSCKAYYRPAGDLPVHYEKCGEDGKWSPGQSQSFSCVPDCGLSEVPKTPFIVNGKSIKRGQWPWHVGIYVEFEGTMTYICGGALITENAVLTSAHCVTRHGSIVDPSKFRVFLGKQTIALPDNDPFVQSRHVSNIFVEESFNHRSLDSDIAIMALETPAVLSYFVRPVCFPQTSNSFLEEYQLTQGNLGTVLGWGATENETLSKELRMTELPVISHQDCVEAYRDFFASMTRSTNYCAGYLNGTSLCNGDSGGGQYFKAIVKGATRWYIQGLVSYGVPKQEGSKHCSSSHYTIFTRIGRYADWIVRTLSRENLI